MWTSDIARMNQLCLIPEVQHKGSRHLLVAISSHTSMSHVPHMHESCATYEWVMSHISMGHVSHMNESCPIYEWVMSHIWMSHVPHMNESCPTDRWVMSHIWMSHAPSQKRITRRVDSCLLYSYVTREWVVLYVCKSHVPHVYGRVMSHIQNESCATYG